jgi:HK97 family phage prohead protease
LELRANESEFALSCVAVAYNVRSAPIGGMFFEQIARGAFTDTLRNDDQVCFFNHDRNQILGRKKSGTLTVEDSPTGLQFRCQLDRQNPAHQSVYAAIKRGDVDGCSFQFTVPEGGDDWQQEQGRAIPLRTVRKAKLDELGPVVWPAYTQGTSVGARSEQRSEYVLAPDWRSEVLTKLRAIDTRYDAQQDAHRRSLCAQIATEIAEGK